MKNIILGKSNNYLSFLLNLIYNNEGKQAEIHIVSNIKDVSEEKRMIPYAIPNMNIEEYFSNNYIYPDECSYILGVYSPKTKIQVYYFFKNHFQIEVNKYKNIIGNNTILPNIYTIGNGCFINNSIIEPFTNIGNFVIINRNCSIGHHCTIKDFATISPGVNIASHSVIGENTFIGIGTTIINNVKIGKNVIVGAGSLVTRNLEDNGVYYGVPAKFVRMNDFSL
jgi:sugar O-acyltransferase (sialic acid O-acetyltransferase NeuD family)